jgi:hypothetical protein
MTPEEVTNRKDAMIYFLLKMQKEPHIRTIGDLFLNSGYSHGIDSFQGILDEMTEKGWLKKTDEPGELVQGFLRTRHITYEVSFDGIEFLSSIGLIEDKFKVKKKSKKIKQTNISGGQVVINEQKNKGNQSLLDNAFESPTTQKISKQTDKKPKRSLIEILSWVAAIIASIIAIYEFLIK